MQFTNSHFYYTFLLQSARGELEKDSPVLLFLQGPFVEKVF